MAFQSFNTALFKTNFNFVFLKVDLYDLVIFDHFWPSDWREDRDEC